MSFWFRTNAVQSGSLYNQASESTPVRLLSQHIPGPQGPPGPQGESFNINETDIAIGFEAGSKQYV